MMKGHIVQNNSVTSLCVFNSIQWSTVVQWNRTKTIFFVFKEMSCRVGYNPRQGLANQTCKVVVNFCDKKNDVSVTPESPFFPRSFL